MANRFQNLAMQMVAYGLTAAENATGGKSNPLMYPFDLKAAVIDVETADALQNFSGWRLQI